MATTSLRWGPPTDSIVSGRFARFHQTNEISEEFQGHRELVKIEPGTRSAFETG